MSEQPTRPDADAQVEADDDVQGFAQFIGQFPSWSLGYGPTGVGGTWGVKQQPSRRIVEMNQQNGGAYPGLR